MDKEIVDAINRLFDEAKKGNEESFEILGEIFLAATHEMINISNREHNRRFLINHCKKH